MAQWQTADAERHFGALVEAAAVRGPQVVMRDNDAVAVVMSPDEYRKLVRQADADFARLLAQCPFEREDFAQQ